MRRVSGQRGPASRRGSCSGYAICAIASKLGCTSETLRKWVRLAEHASGMRPAPTAQDAQRIRDLERENRELRRTNELLIAQVETLAQERDSLKSRLQAARSRIDGLLDRLPLEVKDSA